VDVLRSGGPLTIHVKLGELPNIPGAAVGGGKAVSEGTLRGIAVQDLTGHIRDQLGLSPEVHGVVITELDPSSPAAQAQLQQGDVIVSIDRHAVNSVQDFSRWAAEAKGQTLLRINKHGRGGYVVLTPTGQ